MGNIFKSYDVRGVYPDEVNEEVAYRIGRALVEYLKAGSIAVASDNRSSSPQLTEALLRGITDGGADALTLGLLSTPMLYFAATKLGTDGAVMVTASHNPGEYNGFKICRANAVPVGLSSGLADIRDIVLAGDLPKTRKAGVVRPRDLKSDYYIYLSSFADLNDKRFRIAVDAAHAMGVLEIPVLRKINGLTVVRSLYDTLEPPGTCPHEANPLKTETLEELGSAVRTSGADLGVAYDGDADRIGFVDEHGVPLPMDFVTAILAEALLPEHPGATMLYDLRSSRSVKERIEALGGVAHECMVGHANIKKQMLAEHALFAGELTGHYYFSLAGYAAEMGTLPAILLMNLMAKTGKRPSELIAEVRKYHHSGEINLRVKDIEGVFKKLEAHYRDGLCSKLDGLKVVYPAWWFSLRASNTEPVVRLNLEGNTAEILEERRAELLALIKD